MLDITGGVELLFNADEKLTHYCVYSISPGKVSLVRFVHGQLQFLRNESVKPPAGFRQLRFSKRGIYYLLSFDTGGGTWGAPLGGDVFYSIPGRPFTNVVEIKEPDSGYVGIRAITGQLQTKSVVTRRVTLTTTANQMVLKPSGAAGTWNQTQVLPGAILESGNGTPYQDERGYRYLYVVCSDAARTDQESGGRITTGVAKSKDLIHWEWGSSGKPVLAATQGAWDSIGVFVNGALAMPEGKYPGRLVLFYAGFGGAWNGQGLAWSDSPEGPFVKDERNPVIKGDVACHEGHLTRIGDAYHYFRTVFHEGDRAYHSTSPELVHWQHEPQPILSPNVGDWDGEHVRPRSVLKVDDDYYMFYEGAARDAQRATQMPERWWDSIGLARSKDLVHWKRSPYNPFIVQRPGADDGAIWTGWPRAILNGDNVLVYHALGGYDFLKPTHNAGTALTIIPLSVLTNTAW